MEDRSEFRKNADETCSEAIDEVNSPDFMALEERLMFDGAMGVEAADVALDHADQDVPAHSGPDTALEAAAAALAVPPADRSEIYFIDGSTKDAQNIVAALPEGAELVVIDANSDGVAQIAAALDGRAGIEAIHILSHGSAGQISLGGVSMDAGSMTGIHSEALARIGDALSDDADIMIYGCDFGQDDTALAALATATGADVAASTNPTGAASLGGDWALEAATGAIEATALNAAGYGALLAAPEITLPETSVVGSEDTPISIDGLTVADADGDTLSVTLGVGNGAIALAGTAGLTGVTGDGSASVSFSGSAADINAALSGMTYTGGQDYYGPETLAISVNDGSTTVTDTLSIDVAAQNDDPVLAPTNLTAAEGGTVTIADTIFGVTDVDLDVSLAAPQLSKQLVFKVAPGGTPGQGTLMLNDNPLLAGSTFSLADVENGLLSYAHDGSDVAAGDTDTFQVTINDGGGGGDIGPTAITVNLLPVNDAPSIAGNPDVFEGEGTEIAFGTAQPTASKDIGASLTITDIDDAVGDMQVTISNIQNDGEGVLFRDADGNGEYDAGEELANGDSFDAVDLGNGLLRFSHDGSEPNGVNPTFDIAVTDAGGGEGPGGVLTSAPETIEIEVKPNDDEPDLTTNTPVTVTAGMGNTVTLDNTVLEATDPDSPTSSTAFVVTQVPANGELRLDGLILGVGARFSQADIDAGLLSYRQTAAFADGDTDTFNFEVRDSSLRAFNNAGQEGADRDATGNVIEHTFTINFSGTEPTGTAPGDPAPGRSGTVALESSTSGSVNVIEGDGAPGGTDTATITTADLSYVLEQRDANGATPIAAGETIYRIIGAPSNGTIYLNGAALGTFSSFTQDDIDNGRVTFTHDGGEDHQAALAYSVSGGTAQTFDGTLALTATPVNDAPTVATANPGLIVEGATTRITSANIILRDVDTANEPGENGGANDPAGEAAADDLMFRITDLPDTGTLQRFDGANWVDVTTDDLLSADLLGAAADGATGGLRYVHDGSENFSDIFNVVVRDDLTSPGTFGALSEGIEGTAAPGNISGTDSVTITIAPQNDAPITPENEAAPEIGYTDNSGTPQSPANNILYLEEAATGAIDDTLLKVVDPDNPDPDTLQYRIVTATQFGKVTVGGRPVGVGSTFTQADIDNGVVAYVHEGGEDAGDSFQFVVSDSVDDHVYAPGGTGGVSTFDIVISGGRNDTPEIANGGSDTIDVFGSGNFTHDFGNSLTITDADLDTVGAGEVDFIQAVVVVKDAGGNPVDLSGTGGITPGTAGASTVGTDLSVGTAKFQGTLAQVQAALTDLQVELPNTDNNAEFTVELTVDDRLRDAAGDLTTGANGDDDGTQNEDGTPIDAINNRDTISVTLRASTENNDPTLTGIPGDKTVNEDSVLDLAGYVIEDVDAFGSDVTVTLAVANGHLSVTGTPTTADPATLTLTGTVAEVNAQLTQLKYIANTDFHSRDGATNNLSSDDTLTITVNDGGNSGSDGGADVALTPTQIAINPVNDTPTLSVPGTQTLDSGTSITFSGSDAVQVADPKDTDPGKTPFVNTQQVIVTIPSGTGTLSVSGATLTDSNGDAETLVLTGTLADINAELNTLTFTAPPSGANSDTVVPVTVVFSDRANGGEALTPDGVGGVQKATDSFNLQVSSTNDAPSITLIPDTVAPEDGSLTFSTANGNAIIVSDPDDFGGDMQTTVTVNYGTLTAAPGTAQTITGDGTGTLTFIGTEAEINTLLDGLVYTPDANYHSAGSIGTDTITVTIDDLGNTGSGGAKTATQAATIDITPVNDRPVASGGPETVTSIREDSTGTGQSFSGLLSGNYSDARDDQSGPGGDTSTDLSYVAIVGSTDYDAAQGSWQVSDGSSGWIDIPAAGLNTRNALIFEASREIRFDPAPNFHGTPGTLNVRLADDSSALNTSASASELRDLRSEGGIGRTGSWSFRTVVVQTSITPENDPPMAAGPATLPAVSEDAPTPPGATVGSLFSGAYSDPTDDRTGTTGGGDTSSPLGGIAIVGNTATAAEGTWQYRADGSSPWIDIAPGANSDSNAITLPNNASLRFVPASDFNGTPGSLLVRLADSPRSVSTQDISGQVGNDPARNDDIWSNAIHLDTSVTPVNDAPVLGGTGTSASVTESDAPNTGTAPQQIVTGANVSDPDIGTNAGVSRFGAGQITVSMDSAAGYDQLTITDPALAGIASVSGGANGADLVITLADTATTAQVNTIVEALRYASNSDTASGQRDITVTLSDGNNDNGGGNDAGGPSALIDTLTASVTIIDANDPPLGADNTLTTLEDTDLTFAAGDFGFSQPGGEPDTMDGVRIDSLPAAGAGVLRLNGTAVTTGQIISQADIIGGNLIFDPAQDANGTGLGDFTFSVRDSNGAFDTAPKTMTLNVTPVNDAPSSTPAFNLTVGEDAGTQTVIGLMQSREEGGGPDEDGQTITFDVKSISDSANFTAAELFDTLPAFTVPSGSGNTLVFAPSDILAAGQTETVTVTVGVTDDGGTANSGNDTGTDQTFTITITGANDAPTGTALPNQSDSDSDTVSVDVSGAFSDPDRDDTLSFSAAGLPPGLGIDAATGLITGTIDPSASTGGPYTVTITASDGTTSTDQSFTWNVANPAPVAADDADSTTEDASITRGAAAGVIQGAGTDSDPDGDTLVVSAVDGAAAGVGAGVAGSAGGTFVVNADGSYSFDPGADFQDLDTGESRVSTVSYQISDGEGGTDTATLRVTVTGVNDAPVAGPLANQSDSDSDTINVDVSGAFTDVDGDTLSFSAAGLPPGLGIDA
ncbi:cadherin-like domain-containing protein, partial [Loktanella salsilacus]|uniref:cadherin-like domain-containing protein n=1 Tax=Loktanella salsilacus TaxID=195913 RepID=UPI0030F9F331